ncbi:MAG: hypothetical protein ACK4VM_04655, partial [Bosea sp. (in: a-proteobacteria)]
MAEQSAGVARDLEQATGALKDMVMQFKLAGGAPRDLERSVISELRQAAPHMKPARAAAPAPAPARRVAGGGGGGWSEY